MVFKGSIKEKNKTIIINAMTPENQGDMALFQEALNLIKEIDGIEKIYAVSTKSSQYKESDVNLVGNEYEIIPLIPPHPRRGLNRPGDMIKETKYSLISMIVYGLIDFIWGQCVLITAKCPNIVRLLLNPYEKKTYQAFKESCALVVKGGGFLHSYGGITSFYVIWYFLFLIKLAQRLNVPVIILPNSFGPFKGLGVSYQIKKTLLKCIFITARESISAKMLGKIISKEVPVYPDMGYYLKSSPPETGQKICKQFALELNQRKCVAFTVRPYRFPKSANPAIAFDRYIDAVAALIKHVSWKGYTPVLVTHVAGPSAHEDDRLAIRLLRTRIEDIEHFWVDFSGNCGDLKSIYGCMDYLVGTRFHSVIFAQDGGVPSLAIAYGGNKAFGIMKDMGLAEYVVDIENIDGSILCSKFDLMIQNKEEIKKKLSAWKRYAIEKRVELKNKINDLINNKG